MHGTTINYTEDGRVYLEVYLPDVPSGDTPLFPALITCPGGGWMFHTTSEGEGIASTFLQQGFASFVLHYSVGEYSAFPNPLIEISWAIRTVREHASEWHIDPKKIVIAGFSAGATVAALSATQWTDPRITETLGGEKELYRPDAALLGYGVYDISTIFEGTPFAALAGALSAGAVPDDIRETLLSAGFTLGQFTANSNREVNVVHYVTPETAPCFLIQTRNDEYVPVKNAYMLAEKLDEAKVPYELHVFGSGKHGVFADPSLKDENDTGTDLWVSLCVAWLKAVLKF